MGLKIWVRKRRVYYRKFGVVETGGNEFIISCEFCNVGTSVIFLQALEPLFFSSPMKNILSVPFSAFVRLKYLDIRIFQKKNSILFLKTSLFGFTNCDDILYKLYRNTHSFKTKFGVSKFLFSLLTEK